MLILLAAKEVMSRTRNVDGRNDRPRGPWVAHLRKRSKVTVEPIIENPRGII